MVGFGGLGGLAHKPKAHDFPVQSSLIPHSSPESAHCATRSVPTRLATIHDLPRRATMSTSTPSPSDDNANRSLTRYDFLAGYARTRSQEVVAYYFCPLRDSLHLTRMIPWFSVQWSVSDLSFAGTLRVHGSDFLFGPVRLARRWAECAVILRLTGE